MKIAVLVAPVLLGLVLSSCKSCKKKLPDENPAGRDYMVDKAAQEKEWAKTFVNLVLARTCAR